MYKREGISNEPCTSKSYEGSEIMSVQKRQVFGQRRMEKNPKEKQRYICPERQNWVAISLAKFSYRWVHIAWSPLCFKYLILVLLGKSGILLFIIVLPSSIVFYLDSNICIIYLALEGFQFTPKVDFHSRANIGVFQVLFHSWESLLSSPPSSFSLSYFKWPLVHVTATTFLNRAPDLSIASSKLIS